MMRNWGVVICTIMFAWVAASHGSTLYFITVPHPRLIEPGCSKVFVLHGDSVLVDKFTIEPERRIQSVLLNPILGVLVVVRYVDDPTVGSDEATSYRGEMVIRNIVEDSEERIVSIPFTPLSGGYFFCNTENSCGMFIQRAQNDEAVIIHAQGSPLTSVGDAEVPWRKVFTWEFDPLQSCGFVRAFVHPEMGSVFCRQRRHDSAWTPMGLRLDAIELQKFRKPDEAAPILECYWNAALVVQTRAYAAFYCYARTERPEVLPFYALYNKTTETTRVWDAPYDRSCIRLLGDYLVVQKLYSDNDEPLEKQDSEFTFYSRHGDLLGAWSAAPDVRLLLADRQELLYREGCAIYRAPLVEGKVAADGKQLVIEDKRLHDVHFAYRAEKE